MRRPCHGFLPHQRNDADKVKSLLTWYASIPQYAHLGAAVYSHRASFILFTAFAHSSSSSPLSSSPSSNWLELSSSDTRVSADDSSEVIATETVSTLSHSPPSNGPHPACSMAHTTRLKGSTHDSGSGSSFGEVKPVSAFWLNAGDAAGLSTEG